MKEELKTLEAIVDAVGEKDPKYEKGNLLRAGNVLRAMRVRLKKPVVLKKDHGFIGRFAWGRSIVVVEVVGPCKIVGFNYSDALLDRDAAEFRTDEEGIWMDNYVPLSAMPVDVLRLMIEDFNGI